MYYYGGGPSCGCAQQSYQTPCYYTCNSCRNNNSAYAIVLVLFILLVIVLGCRFCN